MRYEVAGEKQLVCFNFLTLPEGLSLLTLFLALGLFWHMNGSVDPLADFGTSCAHILFYSPQSIGVLIPERKLDLKNTISGHRSNPRVDTLINMAATPLPAVFLLLSPSTAGCSVATRGGSGCSFNLWPCLNGHVVSFTSSAESNSSWI